MSQCGKLSKSLVLASCHNSNPAIDAAIILINFDDWVKGKKTITKGVVSTLTLPKSAQGYKYESHDNAFEAECALSKGTYSNSFTHKVLCRVFAKSQSVKDELNALAGSRVVAITKNLDSDPESVRYEVFGGDNGLVVSELTISSVASDGIMCQFSLATDEKAKESQLPLTLDAGTPETTDTLVAGLTTPAV